MFYYLRYIEYLKYSLSFYCISLAMYNQENIAVGYCIMTIINILIILKIPIFRIREIDREKRIPKSNCLMIY